MTLNMEEELLKLLSEQEIAVRYRKIDTLYQDTGHFRRELYPKHVEWMNASLQHSQLAFIAANRTGKTLTAACLMSWHLTGEYPTWYTGRRFLNAISAWAIGQTAQLTVEVMQDALLGDISSPETFGTGTIPRDRIIGSSRKAGSSNAIETIRIRHTSGSISRLTFKSYEQGRTVLQGTKKQVIWLDEEPTDMGVYTECLTRTADKYEPGIILCTFTPLFGMSDIVLSFLEGGQFPEDNVPSHDNDKFVTNVTWDDVPHLTKEWKERTYNSYSPHERGARSLGIPSLGAGAVYPISEEDIVVEPLPGGIPDWWPRCYALDVGWNKTAAVWLAIDPDSQAIYVYREYFVGNLHPAIHASNLQHPDDWIPGVIDPAAQGRSQSDGFKLLDIYREYGLNLELADNSVEAGIYDVRSKLESGRLKIYSTLSSLRKQYRTYARDENGKIKQQTQECRHDLLDALRYGIRSGISLAITKPDSFDRTVISSSSQIMGRSKITGY